jgi:hypothetical protein
MGIRRVVPAIAVTLAVYAGLAFAAAGFLREHYLAPLVTTSINFNLPGTGTAWIISQWSAKNGRFAFAGDPPSSLVNQFCSSVPADKAGPAHRRDHLAGPPPRCLMHKNALASSTWQGGLFKST